MNSPQGAQILQLESELQQVRDQGAMTGGTGSYPAGNASPSTSGSPAMTAASPVASSSPTSPSSTSPSAPMSTSSSTSAQGNGTIPSVMGLTFSQAQSKIQGAGFSTNPSGNTASGKVFSQTPQAGGVFPKGGTVDIALK